jgi:uncharacterized protein YgiM (DUF1202 family)
MKRYLRYLVFVLAALAVAAAPKAVYVNSIRAVIMDTPSMKGKPVVTAVRGDKLTVLGEQNRWYNVRKNGKTGWVSTLLVRPEPPSGKASVFSKPGEDLSKGSRRRASAVTSAAAARGLTPEDRARLGFDARVDYADLEKVEALTITKKELSDFLRQRR